MIENSTVFFWAHGRLKSAQNIQKYEFLQGLQQLRQALICCGLQPSQMVVVAVVVVVVVVMVIAGVGAVAVAM